MGNKIPYFFEEKKSTSAALASGRYAMLSVDQFPPNRPRDPRVLGLRSNGAYTKKDYS